MGSEISGGLLKGIEEQRVREAMIPPYSLPVQERSAALCAEVYQTQRMKEAALEHVRWRSVQLDEADPAVAAVAGAMRASARAYEQSDPVRDLRLLRGTGEPGSASLAQAGFLEQAHKRSLEAGEERSVAQ